MFRIDKLIQNFDWLTLSIVILISVIGILTIFSATRQAVRGETIRATFYIKQMIWLVISIWPRLFLSASITSGSAG
jgi:rod shape determining protein RodA